MARRLVVLALPPGVTSIADDDSGEMTDDPPTSITHMHWIYEFCKENEEHNDYDLEESGKWLMFYNNWDIDDAWARAKHLYRSGQLPNISSMKVSTAMPTEYPADTHVICFYCGPASDEAKVRTIGLDLARKMRYAFKQNHISYKTDAQTLQGIHGSTYIIRLH